MAKMPNTGENENNLGAMERAVADVTRRAEAERTYNTTRFGACEGSAQRELITGKINKTNTKLGL